MVVLFSYIIDCRIVLFLVALDYIDLRCILSKLFRPSNDRNYKTMHVRLVLEVHDFS